MRWNLSTLLAQLAHPIAQKGPQQPPEVIRAGNADIEGVSIDSRNLPKAALFVPIVARRNGHEFAAGAVSAGAHALLIGRGHESFVSAIPEDPRVSLILVDDTTEALQRLAAAQTEPQSPRICITGSNGKTTTRSLVGSVLRQKFSRVQETRGNYNNHLGVPLTLLAEPEHPDARLLEFGMSAAGENDRLAQIFSPDMAIITSIALEHLEQMGTLADIAAAEAEPLAHLPEEALVVMPFAQPLLEEQLNRVQKTKSLRVWRVGFEREAPVRVELLGIDTMTRGVVHFPDGASQAITVGIVGKHNLLNAAYALVIGRELGIDLATMAAALEKVESVGDRGRRIAWREHSLIADCYNANPGSMEAALHSLSLMHLTPGGSQKGDSGTRTRKIAVLGDMLELGPEEAQLHRDLGTWAAQEGLDALFGYGKLIQNTVDAAQAAGLSANTLESDPERAAHCLKAYLEQDPEPAVMLFKASRGVFLERVLEALITLA